MTILRRERLVFALPAAAAMATVALGLRIGGGSALTAAVVEGAPLSGAGTGLAWTVAVYREDGTVREPVAGLAIDLTAHVGERAAAASTWHGTTNEDGVAEALLPPIPGITSAAGLQGIELDVRAAGTALAIGPAREPPAGGNSNSNSERPARATRPVSGWMPFARRDGSLALDVATLGARAAPGFPAVLWVRATDATTGAPRQGVSIEVDRDSSLAAIDDAGRRTDSAGWVEVGVTPIGLAVALTIGGHAPDGRAGYWSGGLFMSPGAPRLDVPVRIDPVAGPTLTLEAPAARRQAYVEIDDARGRAWATTRTLEVGESASVQAPPLAPGLYWAIAATSATGASELGAGSIARPFFVAASDGDALALGTDRTTCSPPRDVRESARALGSCLAVATVTPVKRWMALDGFAARYAAQRVARTRGLVVALGALLVAALLETALLLRAAALARAGLRVALHAGADAGATLRRAPAQRWTIAIALLVGLLGLALLATFLLWVS